MHGKYFGAFLAVSVAIAPPALAAGDIRHGAASDHRAGAFGGFTVRVPLGQRGAAKPEARLQMTTYRMDSAQPWRMRELDRKGLELGVTKAGKPLLFAGGRNVAQTKEKMGLSTGTTLLIVAGVVVVVILVAAAAASATSDLLNPCGEEVDCD